MKSLFALFLALPCISYGATYNCLIERKDNQSENNKKIWSGTMTLTGNKKITAEIVLIKPDGKGVPLDKVTIEKSMGSGETALQAARSQLLPFEGDLAIGLKTEKGHLIISSGQVDTSRSDNVIPFGAMAWSSKDAKELGVKDYSKNLEFSCLLK